MSLVIVFPSHQTSLAERSCRILARSVRPASAASGPPARARRSARRPAVRPARSRSESGELVGIDILLAIDAALFLLGRTVSRIEARPECHGEQNPLYGFSGGYPPT